MGRPAPVLTVIEACRGCGKPVRVGDMPRRSYRRGGVLREHVVHKCAECVGTAKIASDALFYERHAGEVSERTARRYHESKADPVVFMWRRARQRAKAHGIRFTIAPAHLFLPTHCPVLGIRLTRPGDGLTEASPTIDRLKPRRGYVPGNVAVISMKANRLKNNATLEELERIVAWMRSKGVR